MKAWPPPLVLTIRHLGRQAGGGGARVAGAGRGPRGAAGAALTHCSLRTDRGARATAPRPELAAILGMRVPKKLAFIVCMLR